MKKFKKILASVLALFLSVQVISDEHVFASENDERANVAKEQTVYVYTKFENEPSNAVKNAHGWYTIGKITLPIYEECGETWKKKNDLDAGILNTHDNKYYEDIKNALVSIERYTGSKDLNISGMQPKALIADKGATDYFGETDYRWVWHLDCIIPASQTSWHEVVYRDGSEDGDHLIDDNGKASSEVIVKYPHGHKLTGAPTPQRKGYNFVGWKAIGPNTPAYPESPGSEDVIVNDDGLVYEAQWERKPAVEVTVNFKAINGYFIKDDEKVTEIDVNVTLPNEDESIILYDSLVPASYPEEGYSNIRNWDSDPVNAEITKNGNKEFIVTFDKDDNNDNIPDKYQTTVTFGVVNGRFYDGEIPLSTQVEKVVTLRDVAGNLSETGTYTLTEEDVPVSKATDNYIEDRTWDIDPVGESISKETRKHFIATYNKKKQYDVKVEFYLNGKKYDEEVSKEEFESTFTGAFEKSIEVDDINYMLDRIENNGLIVSDTKENVVKVYYVTDDNNDEIPDKYQAEVTYKAVNGTVSLDRTYVTLVDEDGNYAEDGKGYLSAELIAVASANAGYNQASLAWSPNAPTTKTAITGDVTYTATFEANPVTPVDPELPEPPTPEEPEPTPEPEVPEEPVIPEVPVEPIDPVNPVAPVEPNPAPTPTPVGPVTPVTPVGPDTPVDPADPEDPEVIEDPDTPLDNGEEDIDDEDTPLANLGGWALVNLISMILTVLGGLLLLLSRHKKEEENEESEEVEAIKTRRRWTKVVGTVVGIASVVAFFLTEDMSLKMVMTDKWTILMVVMLLVEIVTLVLGKWWKKEEPEENK